MLWVLFNHIYNSAFFPHHIMVMGNTPYWLYKPLRLLTLGHYAVDIFIVLSGFCLALPAVLSSGHLRGGAIKFYQRRARRIIPPYYISMVFTVGVTWIIVQIGGEPGPAITYLGVITHLLLIHDLFHQTALQINGVLWTISVEWRIYFLLPLVVYLWRKIGPAATTITAVLLSYLLFRTMQHTPLNVMDVFGEGACPQYIGLFVMGTLVPIWLSANILPRSGCRRRLLRRGQCFSSRYL